MHHRGRTRSAFTLIELLVVIAIIAILAVVVVLTLNPAELLRQSRDSNRVSDMSTLNSALSFYGTDQSGASGFNLGSSSVVYVSIPDPSATSTAGDQCQGLGLISLPTSTYSYHCAASSTYRNANGTGWIPVNLQNISSGNPLSSLPIDPTNQSSSRLYYTYTTNGSQFEITTALESQKYKLGGASDVISIDGGTLASVLEKGSKLGLEPLDYGDTSLIGYWPLNEGSNNIAYDNSGNNTTGTWTGTQTGTSGYYSAGHGSYAYAGTFDGSTDWVDDQTSSTGDNLPNFSVSFWFDRTGTSGNAQVVGKLGPGGSATGNGWSLLLIGNSLYFSIQGAGGTIYIDKSVAISTGTWNHAVGTWQSGTISLYLNGVSTGTLQTVGSLGSFSSTGDIRVGNDTNGERFLGFVDGVRVYNRVLSAAEVAAIYNGGK